MRIIILIIIHYMGKNSKIDTSRVRLRQYNVARVKIPIDRLSISGFEYLSFNRQR